MTQSREGCDDYRTLIHTNYGVHSMERVSNVRIDLEIVVMVGEKFQNVGEKYTQGLAHGAHEIVRLERP